MLAKVPVHNAAMVNSIMARSFDFESVIPMINGVDIPAHISGTTVTTAISLGEMMDINGRELITALLVGDDIAVRVLAAHNFSFALGWDDTGTINMIGATAIAGRLLGLNKRQMRHAFGIVLSQMAGSMQNVWDSSTTFKLPQGLSARNGIFPAQLARAVPLSTTGTMRPTPCSEEALSPSISLKQRYVTLKSKPLLTG